MKSANHSGVFILSETAINSACVLGLEFSFWILDHAIKNPTPKVTHAPEVDFLSARFANAALIDTVTLGGRSAFSLSGTSRTDLAKLMCRSSLLSSSCLCSCPTAAARLECALMMPFQSRNSRQILHLEVHSPGFDNTGEGQPEFSEFPLIRGLHGTLLCML
jgi:hypothetical protein